MEPPGRSWGGGHSVQRTHHGTPWQHGTASTSPVPGEGSNLSRILEPLTPLAARATLSPWRPLRNAACASREARWCRFAAASLVRHMTHFDLAIGSGREKGYGTSKIEDGGQAVEVGEVSAEAAVSRARPAIEPLE